MSYGFFCPCVAVMIALLTFTEVAHAFAPESAGAAPKFFPLNQARKSAPLHKSTVAAPPKFYALSKKPPAYALSREAPASMAAEHSHEVISEHNLKSPPSAIARKQAEQILSIFAPAQ